MASQIEYLTGAMSKETNMEEIILEIDVDPDIILGKFQRQMHSLGISNQGEYTSRNVENMGTRNIENRGVGGGIFQGIIPNVRSDPEETQETKKS